LNIVKTLLYYFQDISLSIHRKNSSTSKIKLVWKLKTDMILICHEEVNIYKFIYKKMSNTLNFNSFFKKVF